MIPPLEIKHNIQINALKFENQETLDGVRVGYKEKLVSTIKLINPINIDELVWAHQWSSSLWY